MIVTQPSTITLNTPSRPGVALAAVDNLRVLSHTPSPPSPSPVGLLNFVPEESGPEEGEGGDGVDERKDVHFTWSPRRLSGSRGLGSRALRSSGEGDVEWNRGRGRNGLGMGSGGKGRNGHKSARVEADGRCGERHAL